MTALYIQVHNWSLFSHFILLRSHLSDSLRLDVLLFLGRQRSKVWSLGAYFELALRWWLGWDTCNVLTLKELIYQDRELWLIRVWSLPSLLLYHLPPLLYEGLLIWAVEVLVGQTLLVLFSDSHLLSPCRFNLLIRDTNMPIEKGIACLALLGELRLPSHMRLDHLVVNDRVVPPSWWLSLLALYM